MEALCLGRSPVLTPLQHALRNHRMRNRMYGDVGRRKATPSTFVID